MAFTHTSSVGVTTASRVVKGEKDYTGGLQQSLSEPIDDSETDKLVVVALDVSQIKSIILVSDQDITIETNDGTTPDDTIDLLANVPYYWNTDSYDANLLTTDVTAFYVTNSSGSAALLEMEAVVDPTP